MRDAVVRLKSYYQAQVKALRERARFVTHLSTGLFIGIVALVLGGMMAYFTAIRVWLVRPIQALGRATRVISTGDLGHRIPVLGRDEFGTLAASINTMAASLAENQRRLVAAEHFAMVGEMSAYVAHNIRNPLASIRVTAQTELLDLAADDPGRASFQDIVTSADRLESWLGDLLRFSSPVTLERTLEDVNALVERCAELARPLLARQGLVLTLALDPGLGYVALDRNKIEQVVSAVLSNAIDASPAGSTIRRPGHPARAARHGLHPVRHHEEVGHRPRPRPRAEDRHRPRWDDHHQQPRGGGHRRRDRPAVALRRRRRSIVGWRPS